MVISKAELDRIRGATVVKSKEQALEEKKLFAEQKEQQQARAKERKTRILDNDKNRNNILPPNEFQKEEQEQK